MKLLTVTLLMAAAVIGSPAHARKDCAELKSEIAANIDAKGVKSYNLEIIDAAAESSAKTVGTCNGGSQKIVYQRGAAPALNEDDAAPAAASQG